MAAEVTQRDLRSHSGQIMDAVSRGESFVVTRSGTPIGRTVSAGPISIGSTSARGTVTVTGAVGSGGAWQAWINVRTTGETLHLAVGDPLKVGTLEGQIVSVEPRSLVYESGEKKFSVALGQSLRDGKELKTEEVPSSKAPPETPET
jgi:prevent-host-death family protein